MRRFVIGTAGHVDHGKTTLVHALTGVDTDRLPEEKRRGISIELGFAPLDLGEGLAASIIDVPGHRRLVRTMIAGASGIELVMLVVAADEGVMPQTREHVAVCDLLGIRRALVVVTKTDAVDRELADIAASEARDVLGTRFETAVVACSAKTGEGVEAVRDALRSALRATPVPEKREHARLGVDRVFTVKGAGTVVTGTLVSGSIGVGDALRLVGGSGAHDTTARALHVHDAAVDRASAPIRLAINLSGVAREDVRRGDVVTTDAHARATTMIDVRATKENALSRSAEVLVHAGTAATAARIDAIEPAESGPVARLRLSHPLVVVGGDRVILRSGAEGRQGGVVGGGLVLDARPERRASGAKRRALLPALSTLDALTCLRALVDAAAPRPLLRAALPSRFALDATALSRAAERLVQECTFARVGDAGWVSRPHLDALVAKAREWVRAHHEQAPLTRGLPLETLRARLSTPGGRVVAEEAIRVACSGGDAKSRLVVDGDVVRMPRSASAASAEALVLTQAVSRALSESRAAGTTETSLSQKVTQSGAALRAALQKLAQDGTAVRLGDLWFAQSEIDEARRRMGAHFERAKTLTVVEFKELTGLARKQAVLFLEHFDRLGLTRREGDARVLR